MVAYPTDLPLAEIKNIVAIVRAGEIAAKKADFAHDVWIVQGYAQSRILGDPSISLISSQASKDCEDPVALLEKIVASSNTVSAQGLKDVLSNVDWATILQWAVKILLDQLIK